MIDGYGVSGGGDTSGNPSRPLPKPKQLASFRTCGNNIDVNYLHIYVYDIISMLRITMLLGKTSVHVLFYIDVIESDFI